MRATSFLAIASLLAILAAPPARAQTATVCGTAGCPLNYHPSTYQCIRSGVCPPSNYPCGSFGDQPNTTTCVSDNVALTWTACGDWYFCPAGFFQVGTGRCSFTSTIPATSRTCTKVAPPNPLGPNIYCGTANCPAGYHPKTYQCIFTNACGATTYPCGSFNDQPNTTTCESDAIASTWTACGAWYSACPAGFFQTSTGTCTYTGSITTTSRTCSKQAPPNPLGANTYCGTGINVCPAGTHPVSYQCVYTSVCGSPNYPCGSFGDTPNTTTCASDDVPPGTSWTACGGSLTCPDGFAMTGMGTCRFGTTTATSVTCTKHLLSLPQFTQCGTWPLGCGTGFHPVSYQCIAYASCGPCPGASFGPNTMTCASDNVLDLYGNWTACGSLYSACPAGFYKVGKGTCGWGGESITCRPLPPPTPGNQIIMCSLPDFRDCPAGYRPVGYTCSTSCGGCIPTSNPTGQAMICEGYQGLASFAQCGGSGLFPKCPSGYHITSYSTCPGWPEFDATLDRLQLNCEQDTLEFWQCGTFCPIGYGVAAYGQCAYSPRRAPPSWVPYTGGISVKCVWAGPRPPAPPTPRPPSTTDLVVGISNGMGATTTIAYYEDSNTLPATTLPIPRPILKSVTTTDGRVGMTSTSYEYSGGTWDAADHRFLGFRYVKATDLAGIASESFFYQGVAYPVGTAEYIYRGNRRAFDYFDVRTEGTGPYKALLRDQYQNECRPGGTGCLVRRVGFDYDAFGLVQVQYEYGDTVVQGDERTIVRSYAALGGYIQDRPGLVTTQTPLGAKLAEERFTYDPRGNVKTKEAWLDIGNRYVTVEETILYDGFGNPLIVKDARGFSTTYTYDLAFNLFPETVTDPLQQKTTAIWNRACGQKTSLTDANQRITRWDYDDLCRLTKETRPDTSATITSYLQFGDPNGQYVEVAVTDGSFDNLWTRRYLDGLGRTYRVVTKPDQIVETSFDSRGLTATTSAPHFTLEAAQLTSYDYDELGRVKMVTHPDLTFVQTIYEPRKVTTVDEMGARTERTYDAYGLLSTTTEYLRIDALTATSYVTKLDHDLLGRLKTLTDARLNVTSYQYDSLDRKLSQNDPDLGNWIFAYDDSNRLTQQADAKGQLLEFDYDPAGRLIRRRLGASVLATFVYDEPGHGDGIGRLTTIAYPSGQTSFSYDALGRVTSQALTVDAVTQTVKTDYDLAGRIQKLTYPDNEVVVHQYDAAGRLTSLGGYVTNAGYDARGNLLSRSLGNGVQEAFSSDPLRYRPATIEASLGLTLIDRLTFDWNPDGRLKSSARAQDPRGSWTFTHDDLGRLTAAVNAGAPEWSELFAYDEIGNLLSRSSAATLATCAVAGGNVCEATLAACAGLPLLPSADCAYCCAAVSAKPPDPANLWRGVYTYPPSASPRPHAPLTAGAWQFRYDANGNMEQVLGAGLTLGYDVENRLSSVNGVAIAYDAQGTRVKAGGRVFLGNLYETNGADATKNYYFGNRRIARADKRAGVPDAVSYYHSDHLGTPYAMTASSGAVTRVQILAPFGRTLSAAGAADPFGMAGERLDDSGLYHLGARYQNPISGQFTSPDSSDLDPSRPQTLNRYAYALNSPLSTVDPTGYWPEDYDYGYCWDWTDQPYVTIDLNPNKYANISLPASDRQIPQWVFDQPDWPQITVASEPGWFWWAMGKLGSALEYLEQAQKVPGNGWTFFFGDTGIGGLLGMAGLVGRLGGAAFEAEGTVARVAELAAAIPAAQRGRITMAVGLAEDASGARQVLIATSEPRALLRSGVFLKPGEILVPSLGDAELNIVAWSRLRGLRLLEVGATRPICPDCAVQIQRVGSRAVTPLKVR